DGASQRPASWIFSWDWPRVGVGDPRVSAAAKGYAERSASTDRRARIVLSGTGWRAAGRRSRGHKRRLPRAFAFSKAIGDLTGWASGWQPDLLQQMNEASGCASNFLRHT